MPKLDFRLLAITQSFENDFYLAEALFYPEVSRFGSDLDRLQYALELSAEKLIESLNPLDVHRRCLPSQVHILEAKIKVTAPRNSYRWQTPIELIFPLVTWSHLEDAAIGFVPALGIEVVTRRAGDLHTLIDREIRAELARRKVVTNLGELARLQRGQAIRIDALSFAGEVRTPKQIISEEKKEGEKKSVLEETCTDLTKATLPTAYEVESLVSRLAETLTGRRPKSVLLVGASGVGKTAALYQLVRNRDSYGLGRTSFYQTSGARLVAGMAGFGMWQERCQNLWREVASQKAILHLGNLVELMEVGKSVQNSQGIASFFRPYLVRGDFLAVTECTPEQLPLIERSDPHLLEAFHLIPVEEPQSEKARAILSACTRELKGKERVDPIDAEGLETLDRLHRRYATYSAYPGRPLRFLRNLIRDHRADPKYPQSGQPLSALQVQSAFSRETGLPLFLLDDTIPLDLVAVRTAFQKQVMGQNEAVEIIINLLATIKVGLTRPQRPIASLLFIGPTGVGKTEMAKALARYFFNDANRLARFDMSEYADPIAVKRLIGGVTTSEGLLTAKVREQPFSVILLDEFEKADPSFFDLMLQVLGEGRLTDAGGRLAVFSNSIVIMTSNLGAESFQQGSIGLLKEVADREAAKRHFVKEVRAFFRPEMFNRLDSIVPFAPLDEATIMQIARREVAGLEHRDGVRFQSLALTVPDDVVEYLARNGFDSRYGARPLKRTIERELLAQLAEGMNTTHTQALRSAEAVLQGNRLQVSVRSQTDKQGRPILKRREDALLNELATRALDLRRRTQRLQSCPATIEMKNEIYRLERLERLQTKEGWIHPDDQKRLPRLPKLRRVIADFDHLAATVFDLEDAMLKAIYQKTESDQQSLSAALHSASHRWEELLLATYGLRFQTADAITLAVFGENLQWLFELASTYYRLMSGAVADSEIRYFTATTDDRNPEEPYPLVSLPQSKTEAGNNLPSLLLGRTVTKRRPENPKAFWSSPLDGVVGIVIGAKFPMAYPRFESESGLHTLTQQKKSHRLLVHTTEVKPSDYWFAEDLQKRGAIAHQDKRRHYNADEQVIEDVSYKKRFEWTNRTLDETIARFAEEKLLMDAQALLGKETQDEEG